MKPKTKAGKKEKAATPLPEVEWDFYRLGEEETSLAFWWEYARSSEAVKTEVEKMRAERKGRVWHYSPREHRLGEVICWLARRESFPSVPWLELAGDGIVRLAVAQNPANPSFDGGIRVDLRPGIGFKHVWCGDVRAVRAMLSEQASTVVPSPEDKIIPTPSSSHFEFEISWHLTDAEIVETVAAIIKDSRPKQFESCAKTPLVQRGFREALPFQKAAALQWLGVLRRRKEVETWREYFRLYCNGNFDRGAERAREEDCRKTRLIQAWFDNGTPLKKEDFK